MPQFGRKSMERLNTCHPKLRELFLKVVENFDCSIICGIRTRTAQNIAFKEGRSKVQWPDSKHNIEIDNELSKAVDVSPYPIDWEDLARMYIFVGYVKRTAEEMGIRIRCGADWDGDGRTKDQNFHDLPHFELLEDN